MTQQTRHVLRFLVCLVVLPAFGTMLFGFAGEDEKTAKLADMPEVIQKALAKLNADDIEIEMELQDGRRVYEVEFDVDDAEVELTLSEDGTLLAIEVEEDDSDDD